MNNFLFPLPETIELFGVTFLVNPITLTIALVPFIVAVLIIIYWRTRVAEYDAEHEHAMAQIVANGLHNDILGAYQFDSKPGIVTDWNGGAHGTNGYHAPAMEQQISPNVRQDLGSPYHGQQASWHNGVAPCAVTEMRADRCENTKFRSLFATVMREVENVLNPTTAPPHELNKLLQQKGCREWDH